MSELEAYRYCPNCKETTIFMYSGSATKGVCMKCDFELNPEEKADLTQAISYTGQERIDMENIFELDFGQPQEHRLKQIKNYTGIGFFTKEATQFYCIECNAEIPLNSNRMTCSEKCRKEHTHKMIQQRTIHIGKNGYSLCPPNIIARKQFLKESNKRNNRIRIDEAIRQRRRYAIKQFNKYFYGQFGLTDAHFSEYLKGELP